MVESPNARAIRANRWSGSVSVTNRVWSVRRTTGAERKRPGGDPSKKKTKGSVWNVWFDARVRGVIRRQQRWSALIDLTVARGKRVIRCGLPRVNLGHERNNTTS